MRPVGVGTRGRVVRTTFASGPAVFFYLEHVIQFYVSPPRHLGWTRFGRSPSQKRVLRWFFC
jgi:hypothetical protein